jgi:hypothetical protein
MQVAFAPCWHFLFLPGVAAGLPIAPPTKLTPEPFCPDGVSTPVNPAASLHNPSPQAQPGECSGSGKAGAVGRALTVLCDPSAHTLVCSATFGLLELLDFSLVTHSAADALDVACATDLSAPFKAPQPQQHHMSPLPMPDNMPFSASPSKTLFAAPSAFGIDPQMASVAGAEINSASSAFSAPTNVDQGAMRAIRLREPAAVLLERAFLSPVSFACIRHPPHVLAAAALSVVALANLHAVLQSQEGQQGEGAAGEDDQGGAMLWSAYRVGCERFTRASTVAADDPSACGIESVSAILDSQAVVAAAAAAASTTGRSPVPSPPWYPQELSAAAAAAAAAMRAATSAAARVSDTTPPFGLNALVAEAVQDLAAVHVWRSRLPVGPTSQLRAALWDLHSLTS